MKSVFITRRLPPIAEELLARHFKVTARRENKPLSNQQLMSAVTTYDAILSTISDKFTADVISKRKNLQVISNYAVGLDNIDVACARKENIAVYNTPDSVTESTADMTFALLLSLIRNIDAARRFVKDDKWSGWDPELFLGEELSGKTFGILGYGRVGRAVAKRAAGFGLKILYCNNSAGLKTLLARSDYISIHVPLKKDTRHMINKKTIGYMKKKPIIINMARGPIVDTGALADALRRGSIRGACLDVVDPEPLRGDHLLLKMRNCVIVPHIGTATVECRHKMAQRAAENIINHFARRKFV